jgi:hypothetical protein
LFKASEDYRLNLVAVASYRDQLEGLQRPGPGVPPLDLGHLLTLPGVVEEVRAPGRAPHEDWPEIAQVVSRALDALEAARAQEGRAMAVELIALGQSIGDLLGQIADRAPMVVQAYQKKPTDRVQALVQQQGGQSARGPDPGSRSSPTAATSARRSSGSARHLAPYVAFVRTGSDRSWSSSCRKWGGRSVRSAQGGDVEITAARWWKSSGFSKGSRLVQNVE